MIETKKPQRNAAPLILMLILGALASAAVLLTVQIMAGKGGNAAQAPAPAQAHATAPAAAAPVALEPVPANLPKIAYDPTDIPAPIGKRAPQRVKVNLEALEVEAELAPGVSYTYYTFGGKVPGPFVRVRVGDTVEVTFTNNAKSSMYHSVDFHAATGPGGGAVTQAAPGEAKVFSFKALKPGLFVYHCATPLAAQHIANGQYGLMLVEPEGGLPKVDREFYVMQGEMYTAAPYNTPGRQSLDMQKLLDERPEYFVFNGSTTALTEDYPLKANVGETVRLFFGVGGSNVTSTFRVIGEVFDTVYDQASLSSPLTNTQSAITGPGSASIVEMKLDYPGKYMLVDHALSRAARGLVGHLLVEGKEDPSIFHTQTPVANSGGH